MFRFFTIIALIFSTATSRAGFVKNNGDITIRDQQQKEAEAKKKAQNKLLDGIERFSGQSGSGNGSNGNGDGSGSGSGDRTSNNSDKENSSERGESGESKITKYSGPTEQDDNVRDVDPLDLSRKPIFGRAKQKDKYYSGDGWEDETEREDGPADMEVPKFWMPLCFFFDPLYSGDEARKTIKTVVDAFGQCDIAVQVHATTLQTGYAKDDPAKLNANAIAHCDFKNYYEDAGLRGGTQSHPDSDIAADLMCDKGPTYPQETKTGGCATKNGLGSIVDRNQGGWVATHEFGHNVGSPRLGGDELANVGDQAKDGKKADGALAGFGLQLDHATPLGSKKYEDGVPGGTEGAGGSAGDKFTPAGCLSLQGGANDNSKMQLAWNKTAFHAYYQKKGIPNRLNFEGRAKLFLERAGGAVDIAVKRNPHNLIEEEMRKKKANKEVADQPKNSLGHFTVTNRVPRQDRETETTTNQVPIPDSPSSQANSIPNFSKTTPRVGGMGYDPSIKGGDDGSGGSSGNFTSTTFDLDSTSTQIERGMGYSDEAKNGNMSVATTSFTPNPSSEVVSQRKKPVKAKKTGKKGKANDRGRIAGDWQRDGGDGRNPAGVTPITVHEKESTGEITGTYESSPSDGAAD